MGKSGSRIDQIINRGLSRQVYRPAKTISLGAFPDIDAYRHVFHQEDILITDGANRMLDQVYFEDEAQDLDLVFVANAEVGLDAAGFGTVHRRALRKRLYQPPLESVLALRRAYKDQPERDRLIVATEPVILPKTDHPLLFLLTVIEGRRVLGFTFGLSYWQVPWNTKHAFYKPRYLKLR